MPCGIYRRGHCRLQAHGDRFRVVENCQRPLFCAPDVCLYPARIWEWFEILQIGGFSLFGIYTLNALIQNYSEGPINIWLKLVLVVGAIGAFWPLNLMANIGGAVLVTSTIIYSSHILKKQLNV